VCSHPYIAKAEQQTGHTPVGSAIAPLPVGCPTVLAGARSRRCPGLEVVTGDQWRLSANLLEPTESPKINASLSFSKGREHAGAPITPTRS